MPESTGRQNKKSREAIKASRPGNQTGGRKVKQVESQSGQTEGKRSNEAGS